MIDETSEAPGAPKTDTIDEIVMPLAPALVARLAPLHAAAVAAQQRWDDAAGILTDSLNLPPGTPMHLDLEAGTLTAHVARVKP